MNNATYYAVSDVGVSTVQFHWDTDYPAGTTYYAQIGVSSTTVPIDDVTGIFASSRTYNTYAIFGSTAGAELIPNTVYFMNISTYPLGGGFTSPTSTSTLAIVESVRVVLPTPHGPAASPAFTSYNTFIFQASTGSGDASQYASTWSQTGNYVFPEPVSSRPLAWTAGPLFATYTATAEGPWYHQVTAANWFDVYNTSSTVFSYVYDVSTPSASNFRSVNAQSLDIPETGWNNKNEGVALNLTVQDPTAGLNTFGYSSGTVPGVIGTWHFDEGSGNRAYNFGPYTGADIDGILRCVGPACRPPGRVAGRFGGAIALTPAASGYVDTSYKGFASDPLNLEGANSYLTLSAWVKLNTSTGTDKYIIGRWNPTSPSAKKYLLLLTNDQGSDPAFNRPAFFYRLSGASSDSKLVAPAGIPNGVWTHIAAVVDGSVDGSVSLYVNGVLSTATVIGAAFTLISMPDLPPTLIGAGFKQGSGGGGVPVVVNDITNSFDGAIDEVRVFNNNYDRTATPPEEVARDFTSGLGWLPHVLISTDAGSSWQLAVSSTTGSPTWQMTTEPNHGVKTDVTFSVPSSNLVTSTSNLTGALATNQVRFVLTDLAGNEMSAGPYGVLVDTTPPAGSTVTIVSSSQGFTGPIVSLSSATWSALASGLTVQVTVQDITSGLSLVPGRFEVRYSTDARNSWTTVTSTVPGAGPYVSLTGTHETKSAQTLSILDLNLVQSDPETGLNNTVKFYVDDLAANTMPEGSYTYDVRVDTTPPAAISSCTALTPYASGQLALSWLAPGNNGSQGSWSGSFHVMYTTDSVLAADDAFWNPANAQVRISSSGILPNATYQRLLTGLINDGTDYYLRVFAKDPAGNFGPLSIGATWATLAHPAVAGGMTAAVKGVSSITWTWSQTDLTSTYSIYSDTETTNPLVVLSTPVGPTQSFAWIGLATNTVYGLQVRAHNPAGRSNLTGDVTAYTLAAQPGVPVISSVSYSTITFSWDSRGNPGYTSFEVGSSTDDFAAFASTPVPFSAGWTQTTTTVYELQPGVSYYFRIQAQNNAASPVKTLLSTATLTQTFPNIPTSLAGTALGTSSITWTWDSNGSGRATQFRVLSASAATDLADHIPNSIAPGLLSYWTFDDGTARDSAGTNGGTIVGSAPPVSGEVGQALDFSGAAYAEAPFPNAVTGSTPRSVAAWVYPLTADSDRPIAGWGSGASNGDQFFLNLNNGGFKLIGNNVDLSGAGGRPAGAWYFVVGTYDGTTAKLYVNGSLDASGPLSLNTVATNFNIGRLLRSPAPICCFQGTIDEVAVFSKELSLLDVQDLHGKGLQGRPYREAPGLVQTGLSTNTAYGIQVDAFALSGSGGLTQRTTVYTLAAVPGMPALSAATTSAISIDWATNGNPSYTRYEVSFTPDPVFVTAVTTPVPFALNWTQPATTFAELAQGTSYFFRVRARNNEPVNISTTIFSGRGEFWTQPVPATGMTLLYATHVTTSTARWTWNPQGNGNATQYRLFVTSPSPYELTALMGFSGVVSSTFTRTGLSPNYYYDLQAEPFTPTGPAERTGISGGYTLANPPLAPVVLSVTSGSVTLAWNTNSNSGVTRYQVRRSTDEFISDEHIAIPFSANQTAATATIAGLAPFTTYFFKINAMNHVHPVVSTQTVFSMEVSTFTLAPVIENIQGTALGTSSISWTWNPVPNTSTYTVFSASSSVVLVGTANPFFIETGLSTNTAYGIQVRAENFSGIGPLSSATTRYTLAATPGDPQVQPVSSNAVTLAWDVRGNPAGTPFELSLSTNVSFATSVSTPIPFSFGFTASATTLMNLASGTTYSFRLRAQNNEPVNISTTAFTAVTSTRTLGIPGAITNLGISAFFPGQIDLKWTSPGFNGTSGFISEGLYAVAYSTKETDVDSVGSAPTLFIPTAITPGVQFSTSVSGLAYGSTYYMAVFTQNDEGIYSDRSNVKSFKAPMPTRAFTISATNYALGSLPMGTSTIFQIPAHLVSTGNVPVSYVIHGETATTDSPWRLAAPPLPPSETLENQFRLFGAFHPTMPAMITDFYNLGNMNIISTATVMSDGATYTLNQTMRGNDVPPAAAPCIDVAVSTCQARTFWFLLEMPPYTTSRSTQTIRVTISAQ